MLLSRDVYSYSIFVIYLPFQSNLKTAKQAAANSALKEASMSELRDYSEEKAALTKV